MSKEIQTMRMSIKEFASYLDSVVQYNLSLGTKKAHYSEYIAPLVLSQPGQAKTTTCFNVARKNSLDTVLFISATQEQYDISGIPDIVTLPDIGKVTDWIKPEMFRRVPGTMYLFDEATKAPHMMNALSMLAYERRAGMHHIPHGSTIVFAGNRIGDNAGDSPLPTHLANRLNTIHVYMTHKHWLEWAAEAGINPIITGYVAHNGENSFGFNPDQQTNPTHRAWALVNNLMKLNLSKEMLTTAVSGYVGEAAASKLRTYMAYADEMESPESIIANPDGAKVPSGQDGIGRCYAIISSLIGHITPRSIGPIMKYLRRLPSKEMTVYAVKDIMLRFPKLNSDPALKEWKLAHTQLFTPLI